MLAAILWGPHWAGRHILFHTDNLAVVQVVRNLNAVDPLLCNLLRCLYFYSAHYHFPFTAAHIPGIKNVAANALSRNNLTVSLPLPSGPAAHDSSQSSRALPTADPKLELGRLDDSVQELLVAGLSSATMRSYRSGSSHFVLFCFRGISWRFLSTSTSHLGQSGSI